MTFIFSVFLKTTAQEDSQGETKSLLNLFLGDSIYFVTHSWEPNDLLNFRSIG